VLGTCQCWAGYALDLASGACTIKRSSPNDGSQLGVNLNGVADWSTQWVFVDACVGARAWIVQHIDNLNNLYLWSLNENITVNSDNYPTRVAYQRQYSTLLLRDVLQNWPSGVYHVYYDGEGWIDFGMDATILGNNEINGHFGKNISKILFSKMPLARTTLSCM
jgi:hypothetical protein